jgi:hypothetical protein
MEKADFVHEKPSLILEKNGGQNEPQKGKVSSRGMEVEKQRPQKMLER